MSLLSASSLAFRYSSDVLFANVSFSIDPEDRFAVVGPNGAGKSTLLHLLSGALEPTSGTIARRRDLNVAVAEQESSIDDCDTLLHWILAVQPELAALHERIRALEPALADSAIAAEYADRICAYRELGGFAAEAYAERTLAGLGFASSDLDRPVASLSGGERSRAALARALSTPSDLLILDEPTNHLDIAGRQWLEQSLASRPGAVILTSHDRALLCSFAHRIVEIDRSTVRIFEGGYDEYRRARAVLDRQAWDAYDAFQRRKRAADRAAERRDQLAVRVARTPEGVRSGKPFYARKAAKVQRTGRLLRERVSGEKAVDKPWQSSPTFDLTFDDVARGGDIAVVAHGLAKSYGSRTLFRDLTFHLRRGDRLVIAGANGTGKTTLLNIIGGSVAPDAGTIRLGANIECAQMTQTLHHLDPLLSPLEICGAGTRTRTLLACLKLRPDCLNRPLADLSGGERTKVALARMLTSGANLLLLDEPTNHLEIEAQEALETALRAYPGAVVVVSHDRFFLTALAAPDEELPTLHLS